MYGGVVGLAEEGGGGAHHGPGRERGWDESPDWSLHYLDVAAPYSPLVSTTHPVSVGGRERPHLLGIQTADSDGRYEGCHSDEDSDDENENLDPVHLGSSSDLRASLHAVDGVLGEYGRQFSVPPVVKQPVDLVKVHHVLVAIKNLNRRIMVCQP